MPLLPNQTADRTHCHQSAMDEWLKQLQEDFNKAAQDSSHWLSTLSQQADQVMEQWVEDSLETLDEIDRALTPTLTEINDQLDEALDSSLDFFEQQLAPWIEEATAPLTRTVNPWLQNHPTCIGCKHYHGTHYGEAMLVCGMHPYGPEDSSCADWESVWPSDNEAPLP